jgi:hypothetical protein
MKWQPGRYHLNDVAPLILWFMDRDAVVLDWDMACLYQTTGRCTEAMAWR